MAKKNLSEFFHDFMEKITHQRHKTQEESTRVDMDQDKRSLDEEIRFNQKNHPQVEQEHVIRESGGQDISAI